MTPITLSLQSWNFPIVLASHLNWFRCHIRELFKMYWKIWLLTRLGKYYWRTISLYHILRQYKTFLLAFDNNDIKMPKISLMTQMIHVISKTIICEKSVNMLHSLHTSLIPPLSFSFIFIHWLDLLNFFATIDYFIFYSYDLVWIQLSNWLDIMKYAKQSFTTIHSRFRKVKILAQNWKVIWHANACVVAIAGC